MYMFIVDLSATRTLISCIAIFSNIWGSKSLAMTRALSCDFLYEYLDWVPWCIHVMQTSLCNSLMYYLPAIGKPQLKDLSDAAHLSFQLQWRNSVPRNLLSCHRYRAFRSAPRTDPKCFHVIKLDLGSAFYLISGLSTVGEQRNMLIRTKRNRLQPRFI